MDRCARGMPAASKIFITSRVVNVCASVRVADMVGRCPTSSDEVGLSRSWSDDVGLNCCVSSCIALVYTSHWKNEMKDIHSGRSLKVWHNDGMEHISDALKERNIILETNDPVVADGFT